MASLTESQMTFWVDTVVRWGQDTSLSAQQDISRLLVSLRNFLQQLLLTLQSASCSSEALRTLPTMGQLLGRLCWNPCVSADEESRRLLLQCLRCLYSTDPQNALERRANQWIQSLLCHLTSEEEGGVMYVLEKNAGTTPQQYYSDTLKKMVASLTEEVNKTRITSTKDEKCRCADLYAVSVACVPLVRCPEAAPLIGALLNIPAAPCRCVDHLSDEFIQAVNTAWLSKKLVMEDSAVVALWCRSLSSLEGAVLNLLQFVLSDPGTASPSLERVVSDSLLPKASSLHCHIFLVVSDVFRSVLIALEQSVAVKVLVQVFTSSFLQSRSLQSPQNKLPLRTFFPHVPHTLLTPLLTAPSEVPKRVWPEHVNMIVRLLQDVSPERNQEEEEEEESSQREELEMWLLLVQCGGWVDVAAELLVSATPEDAHSLLLLLTLYHHHPASRGQHSVRQTMLAQEAWSRLRILFLTHHPPPPPAPPESLNAVKELLSSSPLSDNLVVQLLLNFTIFSPASPWSTDELVLEVLSERILQSKALWFLSSLQFRLNTDSVPDCRLHSRLKILQDRLLLLLSSSCTFTSL